MIAQGYFMKKSASLKKVVSFIRDYCDIDSFSDYPPAHNGLQFENSGSVTKIAAAVNAGLAEIQNAAHMGADLLLVHHGLFWSPIEPVVEYNYEKFKTLIDSDMAVCAVHLPLDAHPEIGNNVLIAKALNLKVSGRCFEHEGQNIGVIANAPRGGTPELCKLLRSLFGETYKEILFGSSAPKKVAICSGSCGDVLPIMRDYGIDTLICGELKLRHFTMAQEMKLNLYPCGHYATERLGIAALGGLVAKKFGLQSCFVEMRNPL